MIILGCDIGGTRIKIGLVRGGHLLGRNEIAARRDQGLAQALTRVARAARPLCRAAGLAWRDVGGFGLSFPG